MEGPETLNVIGTPVQSSTFPTAWGIVEGELFEVGGEPMQVRVAHPPIIPRLGVRGPSLG